MLTKNYYKTLAVTHMGASVALKKQTGVESTPSSTAVNYYISNNYLSFVKLCGQPLTSWDVKPYGVVFGTGSNPATIDDFALSGEMVTNCTITTSQTKNSDEDGTTLTTVYTIVNTASTEITIGEVAAYFNMNASSGASDVVIVERTVLDSPLTIPANGIGQVTYAIRMAYPTD